MDDITESLDEYIKRIIGGSSPIAGITYREMWQMMNRVSDRFDRSEVDRHRGALQAFHDYRSNLMSEAE